MHRQNQLSRIVLLAAVAVLLSGSLTNPLYAAPKTENEKSSRWEKTIQKFEAEDARVSPVKNGILFTGSSSIRLWNVKNDFPNRTILNRGFGGSQISDVLQYLDRIVLKHKPRVIVFYCGDNDVSARKTPERVFNDYKKFTQKVHAELPETKIVFIPIKPSISRWKLWPLMKQANEKIQTFSEANKNLYYCDIVPPMLNEEGTPIESLFRADGLHLNQAGYDIWSEQIETILKKFDH